MFEKLNNEKIYTTKLIIQCLLINLSKEKDKKNKNFIKGYIDFEIDNKNVLLIENLRKKTMTIYYFEGERGEYESFFLGKAMWVKVDLKQIEEKISEINKWLERYV